jgi:hypothetical protein
MWPRMVKPYFHSPSSWRGGTFYYFKIDEISVFTHLVFVNDKSFKRSKNIKRMAYVSLPCHTDILLEKRQQNDQRILNMFKEKSDSFSENKSQRDLSSIT